MFSLCTPCVFALTQPTTVLSKADQSQSGREVQEGKDASEEIAKVAKFVTDKAELARVDRVGQRLAAVANSGSYPALFGNAKCYPFTWHFNIIQDDQVNAFALPGGYVYINSGLLHKVRSDDELAGVLGHEITHSAHHHEVAMSHTRSKMDTGMAIAFIASLLAKVPPRDVANFQAAAGLAEMGVMNNKYGEAAEIDADNGGLILMKKAGFDPLGMLSFMLMLRDIENRSPNVQLGIFQDHPFSQERVDLINAHLKDMHISVDNEGWRQVTGAATICVKDIGRGFKELDIRQANVKDVALVILKDPDGSRATRASAVLNDSLSSGLTWSQVYADKAQLVVGNKVALAVSDDDASAQPGTDADTIAKSAQAELRRILWAQHVTSAEPGTGAM